MTLNPLPTATGMQARLIGAGNRLHLQHGPIDMIIDADGRHRSSLFTAATKAGISVLATLVEELPLFGPAITAAGNSRDPWHGECRRPVIWRMDALSRR